MLADKEGEPDCREDVSVQVTGPCSHAELIHAERHEQNDPPWGAQDDDERR